MARKRRGFDDRPLDSQIQEFLEKYGSGQDPKDLEGCILDIVQKGEIGPAIVKKVIKDESGNVTIETQPIFPKLPIEKQVKIAKDLTTKIDKFLDEEIAKMKKPGEKEYTWDEFERDYPLDYRIKNKETSVVFALERVRTALKEHTRKKYVRNAQCDIWELQELRDKKLKRERHNE